MRDYGGHRDVDAGDAPKRPGVSEARLQVAPKVDLFGDRHDDELRDAQAQELHGRAPLDHALEPEPAHVPEEERREDGERDEQRHTEFAQRWDHASDECPREIREAEEAAALRIGARLEEAAEGDAGARRATLHALRAARGCKKQRGRDSELCVSLGMGESCADDGDDAGERHKRVAAGAFDERRFCVRHERHDYRRNQGLPRTAICLRCSPLVIPPEILDQIRDRVDIVAFVGEYVPLRRGGSSFKGLCPFHAEKSPSFHVNPQRRMYHCFGCSASGDIIGFLMRIEGISFPDAVHRLAERGGIEIEESNERDDVELRRARERKERLKSVMDSATGYFVEQLMAHELGGMARDAIAKRDVTRETATAFRLGYAPFGFQGLVEHLERARHSLEDAVELGLLVRRERGGFYDRFRHRLMFPISDTHGQVVAFSGRALADPPGEVPRPGADPPAKYINSPETPLYRKSEILYGLFEGRVPLRREAVAILCEGNFDLVALHQAGFRTAVAPMGTAFTADQAKLLRRYVERVVLLFDGDAAGRKAIRASFTLLGDAGLSANVVALPEADDPDTFLRREGAPALKERILNAPSAVAYFVDDAAARAVSDPALVARAIADLGPILAALDGPVEKRLWMERIAQRFGVQDLEAVRKQLLSGVRQSRDGRSHDAAHAPEQPPARNPAVAEKPTIAHELLGAVLDQPALFASDEARKLFELLTRDDLRAIFLNSSRMYESRALLDGPSLAASIAGSPAEGWVRERLAKPIHEDQGGAERMLQSGIPRLEMQRLETDMMRMKEQILDARNRGDDARAGELTSAHAALTRQANELRKKRGNFSR